MRGPEDPRRGPGRSRAVTEALAYPGAPRTTVAPLRPRAVRYTRNTHEARPDRLSHPLRDWNRRGADHYPGAERSRRAGPVPDGAARGHRPGDEAVPPWRARPAAPGRSGP